MSKWLTNLQGIKPNRDKLEIVNNKDRQITYWKNLDRQTQDRLVTIIQRPSPLSCLLPCVMASITSASASKNKEMLPLDRVTAG